MVTMEGNMEIYMSLNSDGSRRARIVTATETYSVLKIRNSLSTLVEQDLAAYSKKLATTEFEVLGARGAVSQGGVAILNGRCFRVASLTEFTQRMKSAEDVLPLLDKDIAEISINELRDDLLQGLIGDRVDYGREIEFEIDQDPRLFLSVSGKELSTCMG